MVFAFVNRVYRFIVKKVNGLYWKLECKSFGKGSYIYKPLKINGINNISIGKNVAVEYRTWLAAVPLSQKTKSELIIGDNCSIGHFNHIYATESVIFGKGVLTADKVYVSDNLHKYFNPLVPIKTQGVRQLKRVVIGDGSWLGENVCVIGASIGKNSVVGANSVVTKDIPDYSIAVGVPAKVIRKYDFSLNDWINVK